MSILTADRIHKAWATHPASYLDSYGRAEQVKRLLLDPEEQGPRIRQACTWIDAQRHELGPFIEAQGYGWALDPACYRLGTEAFWQARILQQMSSLWRLEAAAGRPTTMMADVVVRQTFVTRYNLMSPRYWPSQGIHFVVLPVAYFDFAALVWLSFATWCRSARPGAGCNWSVATSLIAHPAPPSSGADPWLLGAIARYLAEAARDFDPDAPDAAAITARRSAFFSSAASDPEMDPADSLDVLRQGGAQITEDALARLHHLAANLAGFSEHMVAICSTIPDAEFRLAFKPGHT